MSLILIQYEGWTVKDSINSSLQPETFYLIQSEDRGGDVAHGRQSSR